ncbi:hypothetical protein [Rhizobium leguminosarum]|uniref:hypothetical protein n=1 Tax=Rhizobium leguminosarum TaxID=384 RepID=UPI0015DAA0A2|nr:hypothetical protein [Rhizobium leguminosarum]NZD50565.1 hypothetical protein [Rhizobium leguminosarum]
MTAAITLWLTFVLAAGTIAWFGTKRQALCLVVVAIAAAPATLLPLGHPAITAPPPGHYTVLGARIDVNEAIYVLLDSGSAPPRYYRLPYSAGTANGLQSALDVAEANGGAVGMRQGEAGSPGFAEEGSGGREEPKLAEPQAIIGGVQ